MGSPHRAQTSTHAACRRRERSEFQSPAFAVEPDTPRRYRVRRQQASARCPRTQSTRRLRAAVPRDVVERIVELLSTLVFAKVSARLNDRQMGRKRSRGRCPRAGKGSATATRPSQEARVPARPVMRRVRNAASGGRRFPGESEISSTRGNPGGASAMSILRMAKDRAAPARAPNSASIPISTESVRMTRGARAGPKIYIGKQLCLGACGQQ